MEFNYTKPGMYMFHAHINRFTDLGWMGMFNVDKHPTTMNQPIAISTSISPKSHQAEELVRTSQYTSATGILLPAFGHH